jgi:hypothetical protein
MKALDLVRVALEKDERSQTKKYGDAEPTCLSARFHVALPQSPQHSKYSWNVGRPKSEGRPRGKLGSGEPAGEATTTTAGAGTGTGAPAASSTTTAGAPVVRIADVKFDKRTLMQFFREIDRADSGFVTKRALVVFLRQRPEIQIQASFHVTMRPHEVIKEQVKTMNEILNRVDEKGKGSVNWDEFTDFFRRAGMLLEYDSDFMANREILSAGSSGNTLANDLRIQRTHQRQFKDVKEGVSDTLAHELRQSFGPGKEQRFRNRRMGSPDLA